jgi:hypothetical protein
MGWWDHNVYGGDSPWDYLGDIAKTIGFKDHDNMHSLVGIQDWSPEIKHKVCKKLERNFRKVLDRGEGMIYPDEVWWQVLAQLILDVGAKFPQDLRYKCIKMCLTDEWAMEGGHQRQEEMARLVHDITFYKDGEPLPWSTDTSKFVKTYMEYLKEIVQTS